MQLLYQMEMGGQNLQDAASLFWQSHDTEEDIKKFADQLVEGVSGHLDEIDDVLSVFSTNWKISRMASIDKNILRIAIYELMHCPDIPVKVTINEAVEIAKCFGTTESGAFVNGILDNVAKKYAAQKDNKD